MRVRDLIETRDDDFGVTLDSVPRIFPEYARDNFRGYFINALTGKVYSFRTFEHEGHLLHGTSPDPFLRDYRYYGSHSMGVRHHLVSVNSHQGHLFVGGQATDIARSFALWREAATAYEVVIVEVYTADGIRTKQHDTFTMPGDRGRLAKWIAAHSASATIMKQTPPSSAKEALIR